MTPFGRYLMQHRWKLLLTTQGIFTSIVLYNRFKNQNESVAPLAQTFPPPAHKPRASQQ